MNIEAVVTNPWSKLVESLGIFGLFAATLYYLSIIGPAVHKETQLMYEKSLLQQRESFTATLLRTQEISLERTKLMDSTVTSTLENFRQDEREDRRLLVGVLKRSDITAEELTEAVEESIEPVKERAAPEPRP
jgi:hypothetical protein